MKTLVLILASIAALTLSVTVNAGTRPDRPTHEGDTGPGPRPSTPGDGGGSGSWSHPERPSRDVSHGSYDDSYDSYDSGDDSYDSYDSSDSSSGGVAVACAPEQIQSNVALTDRALKTLAESKSFAGAARFRGAVAKISSIKNPASRAEAYMKLAGIDAKDAKAVFEFVGAREARGAWIVELERNSNLTEAQAVSVANSLQSALRGGLN